MTPDETFKGWLYRPYIDLTPEAPEGNPQTTGLLFAIRALEKERDYPRLHAVYSFGLRERICQEAGCPEYVVSDLDLLPEQLDTPRWHSLREALLRNWVTPSQETTRLRALWLLHRLYMPRAVLRYSQGAESAEVDAIRGMAKLSLANAKQMALDTSDLERAAKGEAGSWAAVEATYMLAAISAKQRGGEDLGHWVAEHYRQVKAVDEDEHTMAKLTSRYHRVRAFLPQLARDVPSMVRAMDLAEEWADRMSRVTPEQEAEWLVLHCALYESRVKEALVIGAPDLALQRAERYVEIAPLFPQAYLALAQVHIERKEIDPAIHAYDAVVRYGPPFTEVAWFMLGQCREEVGFLRQARECYLRALEIDPEGISSLEQLVGVAGLLGDREVERWAKLRLVALGDPEAEAERFYRRYEGVLGGG